MKSKKLVVEFFVGILCVVCVFLFVTGGTMTDVFLEDYTFYEDESVVTLKVGVQSSIGYVRTMKEREKDGELQLSFYSTYGINSTIGAKNVFTVEVPKECNSISFLRSDGYRSILSKDDDGNWNRVKS